MKPTFEIIQICQIRHSKYHNITFIVFRKIHVVWNDLLQIQGCIIFWLRLVSLKIA